MSLDPARDPITHPVHVWLWVAALLMAHGDSGLATRIQVAMDERRLCDNAMFELTKEEQLRVNAVLQDWLGEPPPD